MRFAALTLRFLGCGFAAVALAACAATAPRAAATAGVETAFEHYCELLRAMDHAGIAAMFAPDGEVANSGAAPIRGPAAINAFLQGFSDYQVLAYTTQGIHTVVHGGTAELTGIFRQRVRVPQGDVVEVAGHLEAHWIRDDKDHWLVQRMATSPL